MSLMLSAPATIPATSAPTFTSAFAPALPATVTYSSTKPESPADSASSITGTSPAPAIRLSSSNSAEKLWETRTTGAPVAQRVWDSRQVHSRWSQEHSALTTRPQQPHGRRIQAQSTRTPVVHARRVGGAEAVYGPSHEGPPVRCPDSEHSHRVQGVGPNG